MNTQNNTVATGTTTIVNHERIFLLTGDMNKHFVCNIEQFGECWNQFEDKDTVKIQHLWNQRFVRCSRKSIIDMAKSLNLANPFKPLK